jgi:hypothetical protein
LIIKSIVIKQELSQPLALLLGQSKELACRGEVVATLVLGVGCLGLLLVSCPALVCELVRWLRSWLVEECCIRWLRLTTTSEQLSCIGNCLILLLRLVIIVDCKRIYIVAGHLRLLRNLSRNCLLLIALMSCNVLVRWLLLLTVVIVGL